MDIDVTIFKSIRHFVYYYMFNFNILWDKEWVNQKYFQFAKVDNNFIF